MTKSDKEQIITTLFRIAEYARVAHHIPGRIRLKLRLSAKKALADVNLEALTNDLPGIEHHRLNSKTGSIVIEYDTTIIHRELWQRLIDLTADQHDAMTTELLTLWESTT